MEFADFSMSLEMNLLIHMIQSKDANSLVFDYSVWEFWKFASLFLVEFRVHHDVWPLPELGLSVVPAVNWIRLLRLFWVPFLI